MTAKIISVIIAETKEVTFNFLYLNIMMSDTIHKSVINK